SAFVLPEVVDPETTVADCDKLNVSIFLPYVTREPGPVTFRVTLADATGRVVMSEVVDRNCGLEDVRMARARASFAAADLPDGGYEVTVRARFGDGEPRATDPVLRHRCQIARGYQQRTTALLQKTVAASAEAAAGDRAVLQGLSLPVTRGFAGEPFVGDSPGLQAVLELEQALANVTAGKPALLGRHGTVTVALPVQGDRTVEATVRLPADAVARPLLLVCGGAPAYDGKGNRPSAPASRAPGWLARECAGLDAAGNFVVAFVESPGSGVAYGQVLGEVVVQLQRLVPEAKGPVVLVLEREAAVAASFVIEKLPAEVRGVVLVAGGMVTRQALGQLHGRAVLGLPVTGHAGSEGLLRTGELVAGKHGAVDLDGSFALEPDPGRAWLFAIAASGPLIERFARTVTAAK
ncbi:MAG TPA: hypothetical protein VK348_03310, partial [Planctomycetota bacterium]|nr:hypothetical protein [Planctomycetota bacterium]